MTITPKFELSQTITDIILSISIPHIRVSSDGIEIVVENNCILHFYAEPMYLLKLVFPDNILISSSSSSSLINNINNEQQEKDIIIEATGEQQFYKSAIYDPNNTTITLTFAKRQHVHIPELELITKLQQSSSKEIPSRWLHEVIDTTTPNNNEDDDNEDANGNNLSHNKHANDNNNNNDNVDTTTTTTTTTINHNETLPNLTQIDNNKQSLSYDGYGFANMFHNIFTEFCREGLAYEMLQLSNPDMTTIVERKEQRQLYEEEKFNIDRYLEDMLINQLEEEDYIYSLAMSFQPHWRTNKHKRNKNKDNTVTVSQKQKSDDDDVSTLHEGIQKLQLNTTIPQTPKTPSSSYFTSDEQYLLATIPFPLLPSSSITGSTAATVQLPLKNNNENKDETIEDNSNKNENNNKTQIPQKESPTINYNNNNDNMYLWYGLLDILFAYVYDHLLTQGEATVESAWTISTLSYTLSWFDTSIISTHETIINCLRRMIIFPYIRNIQFGIYVWEQVIQILTYNDNNAEAISCIIRCLLQVRKILEHSESHYLGNKLYIDPYLAWILHNRRDKQRISSSFLSIPQQLAQEIRNQILGGGEVGTNDKKKEAIISRLKKNIGLYIIEYENMFFSSNDDVDDDNNDDESNASSSDDDDSDTSNSGSSDEDDDSNASEEEEEEEKEEEQRNKKTEMQDLKKDNELDKSYNKELQNQNIEDKTIENIQIVDLTSLPSSKANQMSHQQQENGQSDTTLLIKPILNDNDKPTSKQKIQMDDTNGINNVKPISTELLDCKFSVSNRNDNNNNSSIWTLTPAKSTNRSSMLTDEHDHRKKDDDNTNNDGGTTTTKEGSKPLIQELN